MTNRETSEYLDAARDLAIAAGNLSKLWELADTAQDRELTRTYPSDTLPDFAEVALALFGWAHDLERSMG